MTNCEKAHDETLRQSQELNAPLLASTAALIADMKTAGADPTKVYNVETKKTVNLEQMLEDLTASAEQQVQQINSEFADCEESGVVEPTLQYSLDVAMRFLTGGLSLVLPKHMTHISAKDILEGRILGGPNSVVQKTIGVVFDATGVGKNHVLRTIFANPGKAAADIIPDVTIRWPKGWKTPKFKL